MPIFQRYLLREMTQNALITFSVITLIFLVAGALRVLGDADFLTLGTFLKGAFFFVATNLDRTLPMTVLVAVVTTYGRCAAENEINTLRANGIHVYTAIAPGLLFGLLGAAVVLHVNDRVAPRLSEQKSALLRAGLAGAVDALKSGAGSNLLRLSKEVSVIYEGVDESGIIHHLRVKRYSKDADEGANPLQDEIHARRASIDADFDRNVIDLQLEDVKYLYGRLEGSVTAHLAYPIPIGQDEVEKKLSHHSLAELDAAEFREYPEAKKSRGFQAEFHQRLVSAFACLLFVLVGIPVAIIFRHGSRMVAFLISFLIALVVYYPTVILGEILVKETKLNVGVAMWSGSVVVGLLGGGLLGVVMRR